MLLGINAFVIEPRAGPIEANGMTSPLLESKVFNPSLAQMLRGCQHKTRIDLRSAEQGLKEEAVAQPF
jgi:hypothetical protein